MDAITPLLIAKIIITLIFAMAIPPKLMGKEEPKAMFRKLGAEPHGRIGTAILELLAVVLLWVPGSLARGATLTALVMLGALGSHLTKLGINKMFWMAIVVLLAAIYIISQVGLPL